MDGSSTERRSQWLRGVLDLCILAVLESGESYGYELSQTLEKTGLGPVPGGTLYPVLTRLRGNGLVTTTWREPTSGPARKYYALTDEGRRVLRESGRAWSEFSDRVSDVLRKGGLP
ncbi:PadR family transcriptional regulator [Streptomyces sp. LZ34]